MEPGLWTSLIAALAIAAALYGVFLAIVEGPVWSLLLVPAVALAVAGWALMRREGRPRAIVGGSRRVV